MTIFCHKRTFMQALNYTSARNNLKTLIDNVCDNNEEVIITTKNNKTVVMISMDEYNLTHKKLKQDINDAIKEIENDDFMGIEEAFDLAKKSYRD